VARDFDLTETAVRAWVARAKTERREEAALTSAKRNCRDFVGETAIAVSRLILSPQYMVREFRAVFQPGVPPVTLARPHTRSL
jgi:hypothetical protein